MLWKKAWALFLGAVLVFQAAGQESYDFRGKDIVEILFAVSLSRNFPVCVDDTVNGKADFMWAGGDFEGAFESFLLRNRLYVEKNADKWTVSRMKFQKNDGHYSLDAQDVLPVRLFEKVAVESGICVTWESLPQINVSIHTGFCSLESLLSKITVLCAGYELEKNGDGFHVVRGVMKENEKNSGKCVIRLEDDFSFSCDISNTSFTRVMEKFFSVTGQQFCMNPGEDVKIGRACFQGEYAEETLNLLCLLAGFEWTEIRGTYFINRSKAVNGINEMAREWKLHELKYVTVGEVIPLLNRRFPDIEIMKLKSERAFMHLSNEKESQRLGEFVASLDVKKFHELVNLKYIKAEEFLSNLPPFIEKSSITQTGRGDSFYFTGTKEEFQELMLHMGNIDRPVKRVKYDLLIMQYQSTEGKRWVPLFKAGRVSLGDMNSMGVNLGSVLDLNMDVVSAFGIKFAMELQAAITESKAVVFADTTLNGVSGSLISFQNTNTYRYRDNNLDPETGEPVYSGVTKEIISGLKLDVTGVVNGDGMITSKITASVSRQGTDLSTTTGNPPPTSEKIITTEVRSKNGEPVVLSGLVQNEETENISRVPLLSKIPLIKKLFSASEKSREKTELVIYLIPGTESDEGEEMISERSGREKMLQKILETEETDEI